MREPSSSTRIVVVATGLTTEHFDLIHHAFCCFENIALLNIDDTHVGPDRTPLAARFLQKTEGCHYYLLVTGEFNEWQLHGLPSRKICICQIADGLPGERSVIGVVEQIKSLARVMDTKCIDTREAWLPGWPPAGRCQVRSPSRQSLFQ